MNVFQFFITCKRTDNANNATQYVKLVKNGQESFKRNYYIISPRVIIKAIIITMAKKFLHRCMGAHARVHVHFLRGVWYAFRQVF